MKEETLLSRLFSDGILLALITGTGYFVTTLAESAYLGYFGVYYDFTLLAFPITEIIFVSFVIFILTVFCLMISRPIYKLICPKKLSEERVVFDLWSVLTAYFISFTLIEALMFGKFFISLLIIVPLFIFLFLRYIYFVVQKRRDIVPEEKISDKMFLNTHLDMLIRKHHPGILLVLFLGIILTYTFAQDVGISIAERKTVFNIVETKKQSLIVIAHYGNIIIATPFDRKTRQIISETHLINVDTLEEQGFYLSKESLGSLVSPIQAEGIWYKVDNYINMFWQRIILNFW